MNLIKKIIKWTIIAGIGIIVTLPLRSCYYDSKEYLFPVVNNTCDTSNVTYSVSVVNALDMYCTSCHSGSSPSGNVSLNNYAGVKLQVDNGKLLGTVNHSSGFISMPPEPASKIDDCSLTILQKWVNAGAPNN
jgi:hypothetical protein